VRWKRSASRPLLRRRKGAKVKCWLRFQLDDLRGSGQADGDGQGIFYDPRDDFAGLAGGETADVSFPYVVTDTRGGTDTGQVTVTVKGSGTGLVNLPPLARPDAVSGPASAPIAGDVLADNGVGADSDPEGAALTVTAVNGQAGAVGSALSLPSGAEVTLGASGLFSYDPAGAPAPGPGEALSESFTYTIEDTLGQAASARVTVSREGPVFRVLEGTPGDDAVDLAPGELGPEMPVRILGLEGEDRATFGIAFADAQLSRLEGGFRIETGDGGVIETFGVETLVFADRAFEVDQSPEAIATSLLFEVLLDRAIDPLGLANYKAQLLAGRSLGAIGDEVAAGPEAEGLSGPDPSAFAFLDLSYMQYFERGIDEDGRGFYEPRLEDGRLSEGELAVALIGSEESMSLYEGIFTDGVIIDTDPALL